LGGRERGGALIGGRGTLTSEYPRRTIENYWPYATILFDYIRRAMPAEKPGSLDPNDLYGVVAFALYRGEIIGAEDVMNSSTLQLLQMPNRDGFANARGTFEAFNWR